VFEPLQCIILPWNPSGTDELASAVVRFLGALEDPGDRRIVAPLARREILYRLLTGEQGYLLRSFALGESRSHRVARVVRYLHENYDRSLDIATIADVAHMSTPTLHHTFKDVTSVSPLQYLKQIRLHKARLLMVHDGVGAGEAAHRVGYGSPSQFSPSPRSAVSPALRVTICRTKGRSMHTLSIRIPDELDERLGRESKIADRKRSELVREALVRYLEALERERFMDRMIRAAGALEGDPEVRAVAGEFAAAEQEALGLVEYPVETAALEVAEPEAPLYGEPDGPPEEDER